MPIKPGATLLTFSDSALSVSGNLYCDEITFTEALQNFDRLEYSNQKLRSAPTTTGALPLIVQAFGNQPIQLLTTCTGDVPRPLGPDDANIANIKQRFNIFRYSVKGAANTVTDIGNLFTIWKDHAVRLNSFDLYLGELQMELSINYLESTLQPLTFTNLTNTSLTFSGLALSGVGTTLTNCLVTAFESGVEYEAPSPANDGTSIILQDFTLTFEQRSVSPQGPLTVT